MSANSAVGRGVGVNVGGTGVSVGGTGVAVGGIGVGGTAVGVGGSGVDVGGMDVGVGGVAHATLKTISPKIETRPENGIDLDTVTSCDQMPFRSSVK